MRTNISLGTKRHCFNGQIKGFRKVMLRLMHFTFILAIIFSSQALQAQIIIDPVITCNDITVDADPGVCNAQVELDVTATDNCGQSTTIITYSELFNNGATPGTQCTNWDTFRAQLLPLPYTQMEVSSSLGGSIISTDPPTIAAVAAALLSGATTTGITDGLNTFNVQGGCGGASPELYINQGFCSCATFTSIRPCIGNSNWGGVQGTTCGAATQTLTVQFSAVGSAATVVCTPPSNSVFDIGDTPVVCVATDECGNTATCNLTVTVDDDEPPVAICGVGVTCDDQVAGDTGNNNSIGGAQDVSGAAYVLDANANIFNATTEPHITISGLGDGTYDYYSFQANAGDIGTFDIDGASFDTELFLYNSAGTLQASNDDNGGDPGSTSGLNSMIQNHVFGATDTYVIGVAAFNSFGDPGGVTGATVPAGGTYTLHVSLNNQVACVATVGGAGLAAFVSSSTGGLPWGSATTTDAMDIAFGAGEWDSHFFESVDPNTLFSPTYSTIYLEGSDDSADELEAFLTANQTALEAWVFSGNKILINAGPNEGNGMSLGFGGVQIAYPDFAATVDSPNPGHPIFNGPALPMTTAFSGNSFGHSIICPDPLGATVLLHNTADLSKHVLVEAPWGAGTVMFGGMTTTNFHAPNPQALNLRANILSYLTVVSSGLELVLDDTGNATLDVSDIDGGSFDNCGIASITIDPTLFTCADVGENLVTLTITDLSGNVSTCSTTIEVVDNEVPVITCPADQTLELAFGLCLIDVNGLLATAIDNCPGTIITNDSPFANDAGADASGSYPYGTHTITFTAIDASGNSTTCQTIVDVLDLETPTAACAKNINISLGNLGCAQVSFDMIDEGSSDNCTLVCQEVQVLGPLGGPHDPSLFPDNIFCCEWLGDTLEVLLTVCDQAGNYNTCIGTVKVGQPTPDIICPSDTIVNCDADYSSAATGVAIESDDMQFCTGLIIEESDVITEGNCPQSYTITRTWTGTDAAGNVTTCDQIITVQDTIGPVFDQPDGMYDATIDCNDPNYQGLYDYALMTSIPTASDNCGMDTITFVDYGLQTLEVCEDNIFQQHVRIWTATDECGNTMDFVHTINFTDFSPPAIVCPNGGDAITLSNEIGECTALFDLNAYGGGITDCDPSVQASYILVDLNSGEETSLISCTDVDISITTDLFSGETDWTLSGPNGFFFAGDPNVSNTTFTESFCLTPGDYTFIITDSFGDGICCSFGNGGYDILVDGVSVQGFDDWGGTTGTGSGGDGTNGSVGSISKTVTFTVGATAPGVNLPVGEYWLTCTATDACGNTSTCKTTVTVEDNEAPLLDCSLLADITLNSDEDQCGTTHAWQHPTINENCPGAALELTVNTDSHSVTVDPGTDASSFFPVGTTTLTYTVTDSAGNTASCSFSITVVDNVSPVVQAFGGDNYLIEDFSDNSAGWTLGTEWGIGAATASLCSSNSIEDPDLDHTPTGDNGVAGVVIGGCASTALHPYYYLTSPVVNTAGATSLTLDYWRWLNSDYTPYMKNIVEVYDGTSWQVVWESFGSPGIADQAWMNQNFDISAHANANMQVRFGFNIANGGVFTRSSWSLDDVSITGDGGDPICAVPADVFLNTSQNAIGDCLAPYNWKHPNLFENCGLASYTVSYSAGVPAPGTLPTNGDVISCTSNTEDFYTGQTIVTYNAVDLHGNSWTDSFAVNITDDEAPVTLCQDITIELDSLGTASIVPADVDGGTTDNCDTPALSLDIDTFGCEDIGDNTVSLTAADLSGNSFTCWATVTVEDNIFPIITCADDTGDALDRGTSEDGNLTDCLYTVQGTEFDAFATDNCPGTVITNDLNGTATVAGHNFALGIYTILWTATDHVGNVSTCSITFEITDDQAPVFIYCPEAIVAPAVTGTCANVKSWLEPTVEDIFENCELLSLTGPVFSDPTVMYTPQSNGLGEALFPVGITTVCYTATDVNGLSTDCCFTVTIQDTQNPTITCPPAQNQNFDINCVDAGVPDFTSANATDNCPGVVVTQSPAVGTLISSILVDPQGGDFYLVTLTATDASGNSAQCSFAVTLVDDTGFTVFCPGDQTIFTDSGNGGCNATLPSFLDLVTLADACDTAGISLEQIPPAGTIISGSQTVLITGDDGNGNTYACAFNVTIEDNTPPEFLDACPEDVLVAEMALNTCVANVDLVAPGASDNCGTVTVEGVRSDGLTMSDPYPVGTTIVTWLATDGNGNTTTTTCETLVTVTDPIQPSAVCNAPGSLFSLNNYGYAIVNPSQIDNGSMDNCPCGIADMWLEWDNPSIIDNTITCEHIGSQTVHLYVEDCSGNVSDCWTTITIEDKIEPEFTCPADVTIDCQDAPDPPTTLTGDVIDATDNCEVDTIVYMDVNDLTVCNGTGTIYRTWTVTDIYGNFTECVQTINVVDQDAPEWITSAGALDITLECSDVAGLADAQSLAPLATDNCTAAEDLVYEKTAGDFEEFEACPQSGTYTNTFTATDACGNVSAVYAQVITIEDTTPPTFTQPKDKTFSCEVWGEGQGPDVAGDVTNESDNCDTDLDATWSDNYDGLNGCNGTGEIIRTWTLNDDCGNTTTHTQSIFIIDLISPTFDVVPNDVSVQCIEDVPLAYATYEAFSAAGGSASDNCGLDEDSFAYLGDVSDNGTCPETITRTYQIADNCGNSVIFTQSIVVNDDTPPMLLLPPPITLSCEGDHSPMAAGIAEGMDNCQLASVTSSDTTFAGECANEWTIIRTWLAIDACGNETSNEQIITIIDKTAPTFDLPADVTINCEDSTTPAANGEPTNVSDNCDNDPDVFHSDMSIAGDCPQESIINRTWIITDECGNTAFGIQVITIEDNEAPIPNCPDNLTIFSAPNHPGECGSQLLPGTFIPSPTDNCGAITTTHNVDGGPEVAGDDPEGWYEVGSYSITWTFEDECGNVSSCTRILTVEDNELPTMVCKSSLTTALSPVNGLVTHPAISFDNSSFDNCPGDLTYLINGETTVTFDCDDAANSPVIAVLTVIDANGNSETCDIEVIVQDNTPPQLISCAPPAVVSNDYGQCGAYVTVGQPTVIDNCPVIYNNYNGTADASDWYPIGVTIVTWTITDVGGNGYLTCTSIVHVKDLEPPSVNCEDVTLNLNANGQATLVPVSLVADNCGVASSSLSKTYFNCSDLGTTTASLTVTDYAGNSSFCTFNVTVVDNIPPVALCHNLTISLDGNGSGFTSPALVNNGSYDNCGISNVSLNQNAFDCDDIGTNNVTLTVTDASGNSATCTATITVQDNQNPTIYCPLAIQTNSDAGLCGASIEEFKAQAFDNCIVSIINNSAHAIDAGADAAGFYPVGVHTIVFTAIDGAGNSVSCSATIEVSDNENPTCNAPAVANLLSSDDGNYDCGAYAANFMAIITDNCGIASITNNSPFADTPFADASGVYPVGTTPVTWTIVDIHGNGSICNQMVTVIDDENPTITCPGDTTLNNIEGFCGATIPALAIADDNCDIDRIDYTIDFANGSSTSGSSTGELNTHDVDAGTFFPVGGPHVITYTAYDIFGNTATCAAEYTVVDVEGPNCVAQDITVTLDEDGLVSITPQEVDGGSTDNCGIETMDLDVEMGTCANKGPNTVILTVTDVSGFVSTCAAIVTVVDDEAPNCAAQDITIALGENGQYLLDPAEIDAGSTDNCGVIISASKASFNCVDLGENMVILIVTDPSGNTTGCEASVTVIDNLLPVLTCPEDVDSCNAKGLCEALVTVQLAAATDNCSVTITNDSPYAFSSLADASGVYPVGVHEVTFTAVDQSGNSTSCSTTITVNDCEAPNVICVESTTATLFSEGTVTVPATSIDNGSFDNCPGELLLLINGAAEWEFTCDDIGDNTVTLTVIDPAGNQETCITTVNVQVTTIPTMTCVEDMLVPVDPALCGANVLVPEPAIDGSVCGLVVANDYTGTENASGFYPIGVTEVTYSISDGNGNISECTFTVTVTEYPEPANLSSTNVGNGYMLEWDPIPGTTVCQIKGGPEGGGDFASLIIWGNPGFKFVDMSVLTEGTGYQWKVRCACSTQPLYVSDFSEYDYFTVPNAPGNNMNGEVAEEKDLETSNALNVFPNPNKGEFTIVTDMKDYQFTILDITGKIILQQNGGNDGMHHIDLSGVESGVYFIKLYNNDSTLTEKILIEH